MSCCFSGLFASRGSQKGSDPRFSKSFNAPEPVDRREQKEVMKLLESGDLFRYNRDDANSPVSLVEKQLADYMGFKYCVALNSCGSALFLALRAAGVKEGTKVLGNALTFGAVPSAVYHAGGEFCFVESTRDIVIDVQDLAKKADATGAKFLMLSHMRGRVAELDEVKSVCDARGITIIEDCAHSLGVWWGKTHTGHHSKVCCVSSQSYKIINSGEGGFALTNDEDIGAKICIMAGGYEANFKKHICVPGAEVFDRLVPQRFPNYSVRMSNLTASVLNSQLVSLEGRIKVSNTKYNLVVSNFTRQVEACLSDRVKIYIPQLPKCVRPCFDSLQFVLDVPAETRDAFIAEAKSRGVPLSIFGANGNARNFTAWRFLGDERVAAGIAGCSSTAELVKKAYDVRIPPQFSMYDCEVIADVLTLSLQKAMKA
jgi:dTDP-4-amino-4,6-dideoxygalactose transaminase